MGEDLAQIVSDLWLPQAVPSSSLPRITVKSVNQLLNELAATSPYSNIREEDVRHHQNTNSNQTNRKRDIFKKLFPPHITPLEAKWLVRIILKNMQPAITYKEETLLRGFHPIMPHIFKRMADFRDCSAYFDDKIDPMHKLRREYLREIGRVRTEQYSYFNLRTKHTHTLCYIVWNFDEKRMNNPQTMALFNTILNNCLRLGACIAPMQLNKAEDIRTVIDTMHRETTSQNSINRCINGNNLPTYSRTNYSCFVEVKYDGERAQIHYNSTACPQIQIFSKSLRNSTYDRLGAHQIILDMCKDVNSCVFEAELLSFDESTETIEPFGCLNDLKSRSTTTTAAGVATATDLGGEGAISGYGGGKAFGDGNPNLDLRGLLVEGCEWEEEEEMDDDEGDDNGDGSNKNCGKTTSFSSASSSTEDWAFRSSEDSVNVAAKSSNPSNRHFLVMAFDLLMLDGDWLIRMPLVERRKRLEFNLRWRKNFAEISRLKRVKLFQDMTNNDSIIDYIQKKFDKAVDKRKEEGLVLKYSHSPWVPGEQGLWWKLKRDYIPGLADTGDFVALGASFDPKNSFVDLRFMPGEKRAYPRVNTFYFGCLLNREDVRLKGSKPYYCIVFSTGKLQQGHILDST